MAWCRLWLWLGADPWHNTSSVSQEAQREERRDTDWVGSQNLLQGYTCSEIRISHLLKVLPLPRSVTLGTSPLTHGPLEKLSYSKSLQYLSSNELSE